MTSIDVSVIQVPPVSVALPSRLNVDVSPGGISLTSANSYFPPLYFPSGW